MGALLDGGGNDFVRQPGDLPTNWLYDDEGRDVSLNLSTLGMELEPHATYHYRVIAVERMQAIDTINWFLPPAHGDDRTFSTGTNSEPPPDDLAIGGFPSSPAKIAPALPEARDPSTRRGRDRCQRQQNKINQSRRGNRGRLQCNRVSVQPRTRRRDPSQASTDRRFGFPRDADLGAA